jgi:hypothetical protein
MGPQIPSQHLSYFDKSWLGSLPSPPRHRLRGGRQGGRQFFFEKQWCKEEGFLDLVRTKWEITRSKMPILAYSVDRWHASLVELRRFLKGWGGATCRGGTRERDMSF